MSNPKEDSVVIRLEVQVPRGGAGVTTPYCYAAPCVERPGTTRHTITLPRPPVGGVPQEANVQVASGSTGPGVICATGAAPDMGTNTADHVIGRVYAQGDTPPPVPWPSLCGDAN